MRRQKFFIAAIFVFVLVYFFPVHLFAATRSRARSIRNRKTSRHVSWAPSSLSGSRASLVRQNLEIDRLDLPRIEDDEELEDLVQQKQLVALPVGNGVRIDSRLDSDRRYCKSWTRDFLRDLGREFNQEFGGSIQVNSAVRTMEQQRRLRRYNGNAAPYRGDTASSHLAGLTVDIAKKGLSRREHKWLRTYFAKLRRLGLIEIAEERRQAVFHVMVLKKYAQWRTEEEVAEKR